MKSRAKLKLISSHPAGPSRSFIELTRNIELAEQAPRRFVRVQKEPGTYEMVHGKLVEVR